jgi:hypothetical protein
MSQRAASGDPFVPFDPLPNAASKAAGAPPSLKVVPKAEAGAAFAPMPLPTSAHAHSAANAAARPVVTLQREGDRVTGIRVECGCGQVIELACSY